jgi:hypothetical protein
VLFCLPAAQEVNSLSLIAITTCLTVWVLLVEAWGKSYPNETFFGHNEQCQYTARCSKRTLDDAVKIDGEVDVVELGRVRRRGLLILLIEQILLQCP